MPSKLFFTTLIHSLRDYQQFPFPHSCQLRSLIDSHNKSSLSKPENGKPFLKAKLPFSWQDFDVHINVFQ